MPELKETKTAENLMKAFAGESQARMRYDYYASVARKEGYRQIEAIFAETAANEKEHAKLFFKHLSAGLGTDVVKIEAGYPVCYGTTLENLQASFEGENEEWTELYPHFAEVAREEGFDDIAKTFTGVSQVEERHEARFRKLHANLKEGRVFAAAEAVEWKCRNCGHIMKGTEAPELCPVCDHPQAHFERFVENY